MRRERNYGIDLLRIIAMWMVVILHVLGQGGVLNRAPMLSVRYETLWLLETLAYCAVNCYALISGYVGLHSKFKISNIIGLWLQAAFYSVLVMVIFSVAVPGSVNADIVKRAFFPVASFQYWYFTAYFALFFFTPFLNHLILTLPRQRAKQLVFTLVLLLSVLPTLWHEDLFGTNVGYTPVWLAALYLLGAYVKKYETGRKRSAGKLLLWYLFFCVLSWAVHWALESLTLQKTGEAQLGKYLTEYTSPTILGAALALFLLFSNLNITSAFAKRCIGMLSPHAFGVYLIHTTPLIWVYLLYDRFAFFADHSTKVCVLMVLGTASAIYLACTAIDALRLGLFRLLHVRQLSLWAQEKLYALWNRLTADKSEPALR